VLPCTIEVLRVGVCAAVQLSLLPERLCAAHDHCLFTGYLQRFVQHKETSITHSTQHSHISQAQLSQH
jgi:hypothetical protein